MKGFFITATDTETGKTVITGAIAAALRNRGMQVGVVKPVASGGTAGAGGRLQSEDALFLMQAAGMEARDYSTVNFVCLKPALTPAVAAAESGIAIDMAAVIAQCRSAGARYDTVLVEGVGGIMAPLWQDYLVADMIEELKLPLIIVANPRLGAINHTVLTANYAKQRGFPVAGIIINQWREESAGLLERSNIAYIKRLTGLPVLGLFPFAAGVSVPQRKTESLAGLAEQHLSISDLLCRMEGLKRE
ncbi:dethiobiotin synthase biod [Lucifera butyrica]|uniref:ATP-dependent dethiobiotin synthetase BioD n=1 Tax=Lucifera butyrica TaxID=1351585 RepID=A0A498R924_9FIRM|nr:dethiobiotin synthase [Lucifera butyrica]VBB07447.1 dethiobiotin synthase biod [Lucifera butyrica]